MTQREREILRLIEEDPMISQQELAQRLGIARSSAAVHISNLMKKGYIAGKGYVVCNPTYAVVVGGVNMDIGARSAGELVARDSNPGKVRLSLGGVGRNIAHDLSLLGVEVRLLTALGDDLYGQRIAASCGEVGIDLSRALTVRGEATSTYVFLAGPDGDMALAVSDMAVCDHVTPDYLRSCRNILDNAQLIIMDANIPRESVEWLCSNAKAPLFADPVSTAKAEKLQGVLGGIHTLKPNRIEAEILSGVAIGGEADLRRAAQALLAQGLHRVFISLGREGVYAADRTGEIRMPCLKARMVNATGAGDAFMAGLAWAYLEGSDLERTARLAQAAAAIAVEGEETVNPALSAQAVRQRAGE